MTRSVLTVIAALLTLNSPALAAGPAEQLNDATLRVMQALRDPTMSESGRLDERREHIRGIVNGMFDWQETSRQVLARHWAPLSQHEREEFMELFSDILLRSYLGMIQSYRGEEIAMVLLNETIDGQRAAVRTKLVSKSSVVPITYRFIERATAWKVYDMAIDGISVLSSSQSQIGRLIQHFGYGGMMKMLQMKQRQLVTEQSARSTAIGRVNGANP